VSLERIETLVTLVWVVQGVVMPGLCERSNYWVARKVESVVSAMTSLDTGMY